MNQGGDIHNMSFPTLAINNSGVDAFNMSNNSDITNLFDPHVMKFRDVVHKLDLYFVPAVAIFGMLGNVLSFLVFVCTYLRRMSSSVYLAALALSDTVFLLTVFLSWSNNIGIHVYHKPGFCQFLVYIGYVSSFLSVWYVVTFTVERYVAIRYSLDRHSICTSRRAKIVVLILAATAAVLYSFIFYTVGVVNIELFNAAYCVVLPQHYDTVAAITNVDTFITLVIPTVLITGSNTRIGYALAKFYRGQARLNNRLQRAHGVRYPRNKDSYSDSSFNRLQMNVTRMLLIVSTVFLVCNTPSHAIRVYVYLAKLIDKSYIPSHAFLLTQKLVLFIYYINFAVNFILYNLMGRTFRRAFVRLGSCLKQRMANFFFTQYSFLKTRTKSRSTRTEILVRVRGSAENYS